MPVFSFGGGDIAKKQCAYLNFSQEETDDRHPSRIGEMPVFSFFMTGEGDGGA
jgi:hypothetical protein